MPHVDDNDAVTMTGPAHQQLTGKPIPYSDDLEHVPPDEDDMIDGIVDALHRNNERAFKRHQHAIRDAHSKGHGVLRGELTVYSGLDDDLRQGLFANPATYPVIARLSSTAPEIRSDQVHGVRGIAIKVLGVQGPRARDEFPGSSHDFIMVNSPTFPFKDVRDYLASMGFAAKLAQTPDFALKLNNTVLRGIGALLRPLRIKLPPKVALFARENEHLLGQTYHSASPLRYGKYVAKISVWPLSSSVTQLTDAVIAPRTGYDAHADAVAEFFRNNTAEYEMRVQLCTDPAVMSIDDATVDWPERLSGYQRVAKLTFPPQNPASPARRVYGDDVLSFNSWNGLADHRPMGGINRLKFKVYRASSKFRHDKNDVKRHEPIDISELPD